MHGLRQSTQALLIERTGYDVNASVADPLAYLLLQDPEQYPERTPMKVFTCSVAILALTSSLAFAAAHSEAPMVEAGDQDVSNGIVSARMVKAAENGWLVVHRTDAAKKPGPVVGYAPLRSGDNIDVAAILQEPVAPGDMLMLMVHAETGGMTTGVFEYTLGAKEDGPIRMNDALVMKVITAR